MSKSIKKRIGNVALNLVLVLLTIPVALSIIFKNPVTQTLSAKLVAGFVNEQFGQNFEIEKIELSLLQGVKIQGLRVRDKKGNVLIGMDQLSTRPVFADILNNKLYFKNATLHGAVFNMGSYTGDTTSNLNTLIAGFTSGSSSESSGGSDFKISIGKVKLIDSHFRLFNEEFVEDKDMEMDYNNIVVDSINLELTQFDIIGDSLHFFIQSLSAYEKSGIKVNSMSTDFYLSNRGLIAKDAQISLGESFIDADIGLHTKSWQTYQHYIDSVVMTGLFRPTTMNMADIGNFADILYQMPNTIGLTGYVEGTVANLTGKDIKIKYRSNTRIAGDFSISGLPDFFASTMTGEKLDIQLTTADLKTFRLPISEKTVDFTGLYPAKARLRLTGTFKGMYENFNTKVKISSVFGDLAAQLDFAYRENDTLGFKVSLETNQVDLGSILKQKELIGKSGFKIKARGGGKNMEALQLESSGFIANIQLQDYNYKRIKYKLNYLNDSVSATFRIGDENLMVDGRTTIKQLENPDIQLSAEIAKINLAGLNLLVDPEMVISTQLSAHTTGLNPDSLTGKITLNETYVRHQQNEYFVDSLIVSKDRLDNNETRIALTSEIADLSFTGNYNLTTIGNTVMNFVDNYYNLNSGIDTTLHFEDNNMSLDMLIKKPEIIQDLFLSGLTISPNTTVTGQFSPKSHQISLQLFAPEISIQGIKLIENELTLNDDDNSLILNYNINNLIIKDSTPDDKTVFGLDDFSLSARIEMDSVIYAIVWDNRDSLLKNSGIAKGYIADAIDTTRMNISSANLWINDTLWRIDSNNLLIFSPGGMQFSNFNVFGGKSAFYLNGLFPRKENDTLSARFEDWNLSNFDILTRQYNINPDGIADGNFQISMIRDNLTFVSDLTITDFGLNQEYLGKARVLNTWDNTNSGVFIKTQIIREGNAGIGEVFSADGYYYPFREKDNIELSVSFNRIKLKTFEPFLNEFVSKIEGSTSGSFKIGGSLSEPAIEGSAKLQRTSMIVNYLNTRYSFSNSIDFEKNAISLNNLVIYDTLNNKAEITGKLIHHYFKDPKFNVEVKTDKLLFFNTTRRMNDLYYGTAIASGNIKLQGSPNDIFLSIDAQTRKGTFVNLPLSYSVEISDKDYIIFIAPQDSLLSESEDEKKEIVAESKNNFEIKLNLGVNTEAGVAIDLPSDMGKIEARGNGDLAIGTNSDGDFSLAGDYIVDNGTFLFTLGNLVNKRFGLVQGGRISWTGSPYTAQVNIQGLYKVKTNLQSLGIMVDSTAGYKNKVTVNCYIVLTNELLNPDIKFRISMPDLDPDLQRMVFAELDTTNAAMMNQQMISLLVLGTFSFNNASNINLAGSYYGIIANQLSNMLSQISNDFDIGVNYKPGDNVSQEEFEVALSTQLFDDRLTIDGNFGMTYNRSQQSASNLVGDINIGYKLTLDGRWMLKAFNHSNVNSWYNSSNYDQISPYTQGVGIAFRKEFNNISELFLNARKREKLRTEKLLKEQSQSQPPK